MKKITLFLCFGIGFYFVSSSVYMLMKAELSEYLIEGAWLKTLNDKKIHKPWSWADTYPILSIHFPRIKQTSYVLQGESGRNMAFSSVHIGSSGMPGDTKSTIISGHNDSHFEYLQNLKIGDEIITQDKYKTHSYNVTAVKVVNSKTEKLTIRNINEIVLTTCYPFSDIQIGGDLRYVIYASPNMSDSRII